MSRYVATVHREEDRWLADVDSIGAHTWADSLADLHAQLVEAVESATGESDVEAVLDLRTLDEDVIVRHSGRQRRIEYLGARNGAPIALTETVDAGRTLRGWLKVKDLDRAVLTARTKSA